MKEQKWGGVLWLARNQVCNSSKCYQKQRMQGLFLHEQNRAILQIDTVTHGNAHYDLNVFGTWMFILLAYYSLPISAFPSLLGQPVTISAYF